MRPRLVAISGPFEGETFELTGESFTLGRQADCDLQCANIEVSRRHCEIVRRAEGRFELRDLGSRHGTQINGRRVTTTAVHHSDLISLGSHSFLFLLDESAAASRDPTGSLLPPSASLERRITETLHLDPARVAAALPAQARLARELHALLQLSTGLQEARQVAPLAAQLLDASLEAIPVAERGLVLLREPGVERPLRLAERGEGIGDFGIEWVAGVTDKVLAEGLAMVCPSLAEHDTLSQEPALREVGALLVAPLLDRDGEALGLLYLDRSTQGFAEHHLELVGALAAVASLALQNVLHLRWLERENRRLREADAARHDMIGDSEPMRKVFDLVARVARADSTVLIQGESGTGKELVAHAIHRSSPRCEGPFVAVNCATLSENLLESELFGHEKGAFTGAQARKLGKMESAHRGTLFLDEVAEIPIGLQAKLLRALQEREIERVGGSRPVPVDVRVVAATHRDLEQAVADSAFRQDLLYRLKVIPCLLPALRHRREDIPLLASHFARIHGEKLGCQDLVIAPEARRSLLAYDWPGNVRELGNVLERAVVLGDGEVVRREDLPDEVATAAGPSGWTESAGSTSDSDRTDTEPVDFQTALVETKKRLILDAWHAAGEDYTRTAERLGVHVNSLHRMVKNLDLKQALGR